MNRLLPGSILVLLAAMAWLGGVDSAPASVASEGASAACRVLQASSQPDGIAQSGQAAPPFRQGGAFYTPLAGFSVAARVLAREDYRTGREAGHSPVDLALGWGPMAEPGMAERLDISQSGRWYHYRWGNEGPPIAPQDIARNSANMHMVPASAAVAQALGRLRAGEAVRLHGWLIRIDSDDGWSWVSSLSRDDTGPGSCELVLVCAVGPG